jgi:hypothetical protein
MTAANIVATVMDTEMVAIADNKKNSHTPVSNFFETGFCFLICVIRVICG